MGIFTSFLRLFTGDTSQKTSNDEFHWDIHPINETKEFELNPFIPDEFVAIDLETATDRPNSVCQIAIAIVKNREISGVFSWLVRPPKNEYSPNNIKIHGITPQMTEKSPSMAKLYPILLEHLNSKPLAAHYAYFDSRNLISSLSRKRPIDTPYYIDSCIAARRAYKELENHKLPTVCNHLNIQLPHHHDAKSDVVACAEILNRIGKSPRIPIDHIFDKNVYDCYFFDRAPKPFKVYHQTWNEKYGNSKQSNK